MPACERSRVKLDVQPRQREVRTGVKVIMRPPHSIGLAASTLKPGILEKRGLDLATRITEGIDAARRPRRKAARSICGRPPTCKDWIGQHVRIACAHMSGLFSDLTTLGQDGLRGQ